MSYAQIVAGSKIQFTLYLVDENGRPVSLTPYGQAKLVFLNSAGTRTVIDLPAPGDNPDKGCFEVTITSEESADADGLWASADLELVDADTENTTIVLLTNKFKFVARNAPAA
jgi:hypothetical protein